MVAAPRRMSSAMTSWASTLALRRERQVRWRVTGGFQKTYTRRPRPLPSRSMTVISRPVTRVASSPGFAMVAEQATIRGFEP